MVHYIYPGFQRLSSVCSGFGVWSCLFICFACVCGVCVLFFWVVFSGLLSTSAGMGFELTLLLCFCVRIMSGGIQCPSSAGVIIDIWMGELVEKQVKRPRSYQLRRQQGRRYRTRMEKWGRSIVFGGCGGGGEQFMGQERSEEPQNFVGGD
jgi:hypothetical protein